MNQLNSVLMGWTDWIYEARLIRAERIRNAMKFRKKPVVIEAIQFTGHNDAECLAFCPVAHDPEDTKPSLVIQTLSGLVAVSVGDFIIKGIRGEFYPCKPGIFMETYEDASNPAPQRWRQRMQFMGAPLGPE